VENLCFGKYASLLKAAMSETNESVVNKLFDSIAKPLSLQNKKGEDFYIEKGEASRLINCKMIVPLDIQRSADAQSVQDSIVGYFNDTIVAGVIKANSNKLLQDVAALVKNDTDITNTDKNNLLALENENTLAEFLTNVFLYAIQQKNDFSKETSLVALPTQMQLEISNELMPVIAATDLRLIIETNGRCPNDNCSESLFIKKSDKSAGRYKVTRIKADGADVFDNQIALCPKCHDNYSLSPTDDEVARMKEIKTALLREATALEVAADIKIEEEIGDLLTLISTVSDDELIPLNYNPVKVKQKIPKENKLLLRRTVSNVTTYFNYVKEMFQQLGKEGRLRFDTVATQVKQCYLKERDAGLSHEEIYNALLEWLKTMTNGSHDACDVVISYFVQNCEVFDEITE
jgi:hypothetical protein